MTYGSFTSYLKSLGESHLSIMAVIMGDYDDIISLERSTIEYPALWIETPSVTYTGDNDAAREIYTGAMTVLINGYGDRDIQKQNLDDAFVIARDLLFKLCLVDGLMDIRGRRLDAIETLGNDNDQGWRFEYDIEQPFDGDDDVCYDPDRWDDAVPGTVANSGRKKYLMLEKVIFNDFVKLAGNITYNTSAIPGGGFAITITGHDDYVPVVQISSALVPDTGAQHTIQGSVVNVYLPSSPPSHFIIYIELIKKD